jgi:7-carboxy-7-deazaguanine synthase
VTYSVKEIFYTLQGEGAQSGRAAVFCRFAGCNLWTGREVDRERAVCRFCDTDFVGTDGDGGGKFASADDLARAVARHWPQPTRPRERRYVVCTGGEPLLQLDEAAIHALHRQGFEVAVETNGTLPVPPGIDWVCVSPKAGSVLYVRAGNELKLVFPQEGHSPEDFERLEFQHFFLQPMDGILRKQNADKTVSYCLDHPMWRLSTQVHKAMGIP